MLYIYVTYYDILMGHSTNYNFNYRYDKLYQKMQKDNIDIPYTISDLLNVVHILNKYTIEDDNLYFCVMTDKLYNFTILKDDSMYDESKINNITNEFKRRLDNKNINLTYKF